METKKNNKFKPLPKLRNKKIDKDTLKKAYMASPHIEWASFCREQGFDPTLSKTFPLAEWKSEKKQKIAEETGEFLGQALRSYKVEWTKNVLKTLQDCPVLIDQALDTAEMMLHLLNERQKANPNLNLTRDISMLSRALKDLVEVKHTSLLLDRWSPEAVNSDEDRKNEPVHIYVNGTQGLTEEGIARKMMSYYDKKPANFVEEDE